MIFNVSLVFTRLPAILRYLPATLELVVASTVLSLTLGFFLAVVRMNQIPVLYPVTSFYISFARGTPSIIQLYMVYYGIPLIIQVWNRCFGTDYSTLAPPMLCAIAAFTFNETAFTSETIRAALQSVDRGQWEAAASIGMGTVQTYRRIILPEALAVALPPLGNTIINSFKNTSLAFTCAVIELTAGARLLASHDFRYFESYCSLAIIYYAITLVITRILTWAERKVRCDEQEVNRHAAGTVRTAKVIQRDRDPKGDRR